MTSLPAQVFGLKDRGQIRPGAIADLVVFDASVVNDAATYDEPDHLAEGMTRLHPQRIQTSLGERPRPPLRVVNIERIVQLEARSHGEFDIVLKHGTRTRVSRTYRAQLEKRLGQPL